MTPAASAVLPPVLGSHGAGLNRPECVLAHNSGLLFAADWQGRGGVSIIEPDGTTSRIEALDLHFDLRPNGIALLSDGSFLVAHLGADAGGVYRLAADGEVTPILTEIDGIPLPPTNFVHAALDGTCWISVSTRKEPRALAYRSDIADGFLIRLDRNAAFIAADNLGYTNECIPSPDGTKLYVNETFARRLSVFDIRPNGTLINRRTLTEFGEGTFPDGMAFDVEGHVWVVSIISNRVIRVAPDGAQALFIEDAEVEHLDWVEEAYRSHTMGRPHLDGVRSKALRNISSLAFGGPDLRTAYLGCLLGSEIRSFLSPVAGHAMPHWTTDITPIMRAAKAVRFPANP